MHTLFITFLLSMQIADLFALTTLQELTQLLSFLPTVMALFLKSINFMTKMDEIEELLASMKSFLATWKGNHKRIKLHVIRGNKGFKAFWYSGLLCNAFAAIVPFVSIREHRLSYVMWTPLDYETHEWWFLLMAAYQCVETLCFCGVTVSYDLIPVFCMCIQTGLIEELSEQLRAMEVDDSTSERMAETSEELRKVIESHKKIKFFARQTQKYFSATIFVQGLMSSVILCTCAFTLSLVINEGT